MKRVVKLMPRVAAAVLAGVIGACGQSAQQTPAAAPPAAASSPSAAAAPPAAADAPAKPAVPSWGSLDAWVGKYPYESNLFEQSPISADLKQLLGDRFAVFQTNMKVSGPLSEEHGVLYVSGNKPHEGGGEQAYLLIEPATHRLEVGLWQERKLSVLRSNGAIAPPQDVKSMIENSEQSEPSEPATESEQ